MRTYWEGERVRLRAFRDGDGEAFFAYLQDTASARLRGDKQFPHQREAIDAFVRDQIGTAPVDDNVRLLVEAGDEPVGSIRSFDADTHNGTFSFHISTFQSHQRKGYASEASVLFMRYFFAELRYHKCIQDVFSFNAASIALHERVGFAREGCITEAIYADGSYHDRLVFGMTSQTFAAVHGESRKLIAQGDG